MFKKFFKSFFSNKWKDAELYAGEHVLDHDPLGKCGECDKILAENIECCFVNCECCMVTCECEFSPCSCLRLKRL